MEDGSYKRQLVAHLRETLRNKDGHSEYKKRSLDNDCSLNNVFSERKFIGS